MNTAAIAHPSDIPETDDQKEQESYQDEITQRDNSQMGYFLHFLLGLGFYKTRKNADLWYAFDKLNDPKFAEELLNLKDPGKVQEIESLYQTARKEYNARVLKKQKDSRLTPDQKTTVSIGFLGSRRTLTAESIKQADQTVEAAHTYHQIFNNTRARQAIRVYGLSATYDDFQKQIAQWMKENPGRTFEDALYVNAHALKLKELNTDDRRLDKTQNETLKVASKTLTKEYEAAFNLSKHELDQIQAIIKEIRENPNGMDAEILKGKLNTLLTGKKPTNADVQTTAAAQQTATPSTELVNLATPIPAPSFQPLPNLTQFPMGTTPIPAIPSPIHIPNPSRSLLSQLGSIGGKLGSLGGSASNFLSSKIFGGAIGAGAKKLLAQAIGSIVPGLGNLAAALLPYAKKILSKIPLVGEALNNFLNQTLVTSAKVLAVFVLGILGFMILMPLLAMNNFGLFLSDTSKITTNTTHILNWTAFNRNYLNTPDDLNTHNKMFTWKEFEANYLESLNKLTLK